MTNDILFKNNSRIEPLKKYLYNNYLKEAEIDQRLNEFGDYCYREGVKHGTVVQKNVDRRIALAQKNGRDKKFDALFEYIDEQHDQFILSQKKKK